MTEAEARAWIAARADVSRETTLQLERFVGLVVAESDRQNLVATADLVDIWSRHVVDSLQLVDFARPGAWIDLGTGAGFPGLAVAIVRAEPTVLVEARRKRADFLRAVVATLGLAHVEIRAQRVERLLPSAFPNISARAFAPATRLVEVAHHLSDENSIWLLPKGRSATNELATIQYAWQGEFRLESSVTDPDSAIIVASGISRRAGR